MSGLAFVLADTAILLGGHSDAAFEVFAKESLGGEIQLIADLLDGHIGRFEQGAGLQNNTALDPLGS